MKCAACGYDDNATINENHNCENCIHKITFLDQVIGCEIGTTTISNNTNISDSGQSSSIYDIKKTSDNCNNFERKISDVEKDLKKYGKFISYFIEIISKDDFDACNVFGGNFNWPMSFIYVCPKCGTLRLEVKDEDKEI